MSGIFLKISALFLLLIVAAGVDCPVWALTPEEIMPTPALEARAGALEKELRCPVCQNQSIHDSEAVLARDLRQVVRSKIRDGETDGQIKAWLVERYGTFVLMAPPMQAVTLPLWLCPVAFLAIAGIVGAAFFRRRRQV
ncbi:MAG: cytochrome c-type biogenesis protein [Bdellovibrionales bacterium]